MQIGMKKEVNYFYNPVYTIQGSRSITELPLILKRISPKGCRVLLLAWNPSVFETKVMEKLLSDPVFPTCPVCFTEANPTVEQLYELFKETEAFSPEVVIAVGGGSVLDVGKSLCCLYGKQLSSPDELRELIHTKQLGEPKAKWIGIPTTAGTGSEVTCWATIWDPIKQIKRSVESEQNYAYAAIVDPDFAMGMPVGLAVASALDAVAHGVESYWARGTNAVSRVLALGAVRTIMEDIESLLDGNLQAHEYMSQGSLLAGLAFSNTKTTACHSISYPLTMQYGIPHGAAVSMLLGPVLKINEEKTPNMDLLFQALEVEDASDLEEKIRTILIRAEIPSSLEAWKVDYEKIPELAALGNTKGRADNNPVELSQEMIENILKSIYPERRF